MLNEQQQIRFTMLWTDAQPSVNRYVASLIREPWDVRDVMQNTSMALLRKFSEYDPSQPFLAWALGVAKFEVLGHRRDVARNRLVNNSELLDQYTQVWSEIAPRLDDESASLRDCMRELKARSRQVVELRYAENKPSNEIGDQLGLTAANVRAILKRTREILRRCVERRIAAPGGSA